MPLPLKARLDQLERRLTGPRKIALFGHRAVGKTTLLAMFYREASTGRVPGLRMAALGAKSAEYLAEKIATLEAGQSPAGTLAETELNLRLYHDTARFDLIVKDYQGEHVTLGSEAPIRDFLADCDAVLLCLDPDGSAGATDRRRRQQEVDELLERYIERSTDGTTGRPVALLVTKYDRVVANGGPPPEQAEAFVDAHYGMTRHALLHHAPNSAIFAVSSFGRADDGGRPPADLHPMGLEGPLLWLAERLEDGDREQLQWLWDLAPNDLPRLSRCVRSYEARYPSSPFAIDFRRKLTALKRRKMRQLFARAAVLTVVVVAVAAAYDAFGYQRALRFEHDNRQSAQAVETHWARFLLRHPTQPLFFPGQAKQARQKQKEWVVKAADQRIAIGTAKPEDAADLTRLKEESPDLAGAIDLVEAAREKKRHDERWSQIENAEKIADAPAEDRLAAVRVFLRDYPSTEHRAAAFRLRETLEAQVAERRDRVEKETLDSLVRASALPNADLETTIEKAREFLDRHPRTRWKADAQALIDDSARKLDEAAIAKARDYSKQYPTNFAMRVKRYQDYLKGHPDGGRFTREALDAVKAIDAERDVYTYRIAYDHLVAHPDDVAEAARRLRSYLDANPEGRYAVDAKRYLAWWDKITSPNDYSVVLKRAQVEPGVGKYLSGGAPDLSVEVWVDGVKYGPSPVVKNTHSPIWNYTFPRPIRWKLGDPVVIRIRDHDWSASDVFTLRSVKDDPLSMRLLSGVVRPSKGGRTQVQFASDFQVPSLAKPEKP
jgi:GTPase SAR1 family protein